MKLDKALAIWRSKKPIGRASGKDFWNTIEHCILIAITVKNEDEKQIAKKPNYIGPWFECSNCKKRIGIPNYTINLDVYNYCHHCGQKLDWSEI